LHSEDSDSKSIPSEIKNPSKGVLQKQNVAPPYGSRKGFYPRKVSDFGDGGAFPELNFLQYPLDMGRDKTVLLSVVNFLLDN
jgi:SNW domain-containing protein 1